MTPSPSAATAAHEKPASGELIPARRRALVPTPPPRTGRMPALCTSVGVARELASVYRAMKAGKLDSSEGGRRAYVLSLLGRVIEGALIEERLARLEARSGTK